MLIVPKTAFTPYEIIASKKENIESNQLENKNLIEEPSSKERTAELSVDQIQSSLIANKIVDESLCLTKANALSWLNITPLILLELIDLLTFTHTFEIDDFKIEYSLNELFNHLIAEGGIKEIYLQGSSVMALLKKDPAYLPFCLAEIGIESGDQIIKSMDSAPPSDLDFLLTLQKNDYHLLGQTHHEIFKFILAKLNPAATSSASYIDLQALKKKAFSKFYQPPFPELHALAGLKDIKNNEIDLFLSSLNVGDQLIEKLTRIPLLSIIKLLQKAPLSELKEQIKNQISVLSVFPESGCIKGEYQSLVDYILKIERIHKPETAHERVWLSLFSQYVKGKRGWQPGLEKILIEKFLTTVSKDRKSPTSKIAQEIKFLQRQKIEEENLLPALMAAYLNNTIKSHHANHQAPATVAMALQLFSELKKFDQNEVNAVKLFPCLWQNLKFSRDELTGVWKTIAQLLDHDPSHIDLLLIMLEVNCFLSPSQSPCNLLRHHGQPAVQLTDQKTSLLLPFDPISLLERLTLQTQYLTPEILDLFKPLQVLFDSPIGLELDSPILKTFPSLYSGVSIVKLENALKGLSLFKPLDDKISQLVLHSLLISLQQKPSLFSWVKDHLSICKWLQPSHLNYLFDQLKGHTRNIEEEKVLLEMSELQHSNPEMPLPIRWAFSLTKSSNQCLEAFQLWKQESHLIKDDPMQLIHWKSFAKILAGMRPDLAIQVFEEDSHMVKNFSSFAYHLLKVFNSSSEKTQYSPIVLDFIEKSVQNHHPDSKLLDSLTNLFKKDLKNFTQEFFDGTYPLLKALIFLHAAKKRALNSKVFNEWLAQYGELLFQNLKNREFNNEKLQLWNILNKRNIPIAHHSDSALIIHSILQYLGKHNPICLHIFSEEIDHLRKFLPSDSWNQLWEDWKTPFWNSNPSPEKIKVGIECLKNFTIKKPASLTDKELVQDWLSAIQTFKSEEELYLNLSDFFPSLIKLFDRFPETKKRVVLGLFQGIENLLKDRHLENRELAKILKFLNQLTKGNESILENSGKSIILSLTNNASPDIQLQLIKLGINLNLLEPIVNNFISFYSQNHCEDQKQKSEIYLKRFLEKFLSKSFLSLSEANGAVELFMNPKTIEVFKKNQNFLLALNKLPNSLRRIVIDTVLELIPTASLDHVNSWLSYIKQTLLHQPTKNQKTIASLSLCFNHLLLSIPKENSRQIFDFLNLWRAAQYPFTLNKSASTHLCVIFTESMKNKANLTTIYELMSKEGWGEILSLTDKPILKEAYLLLIKQCLVHQMDKEALFFFSQLALQLKNPKEWDDIEIQSLGNKLIDKWQSVSLTLNSSKDFPIFFQKSLGLLLENIKKIYLSQIENLLVNYKENPLFVKETVANYFLKRCLFELEKNEDQARMVALWDTANKQIFPHLPFSVVIKLIDHLHTTDEVTKIPVKQRFDFYYVFLTLLQEYWFELSDETVYNKEIQNICCKIKSDWENYPDVEKHNKMLKHLIDSCSILFNLIEDDYSEEAMTRLKAVSSKSKQFNQTEILYWNWFFKLLNDLEITEEIQPIIQKFSTK